jgi:hypothetical protein
MPAKGQHYSEETKRKMSKAKKNYIPWNKGWKKPNRKSDLLTGQNCKFCSIPLRGYQKRFCSYACEHGFTKGKTHEDLYGIERAKEIQDKMSKAGKGKRIGYRVPRKTEICKVCNSLFVYKVSYPSKFCSKKCSDDFQRGKTLEERYGSEKATIMKRHVNGTKMHYEEILEQTKILEKEGFRCIPVGKVIPDIIAIKNNNIFAIEVEKGKPHWEKYTDDVRKYFDDIIWILLRDKERKMVKG